MKMGCIKQKRGILTPRFLTNDLLIENHFPFTAKLENF